MAESAVRLFVPDHPQLAATLAGRIRQAMAREMELLASGHIPDFAVFQFQRGIVRGLRRALEECEEAEKEMNG